MILEDWLKAITKNRKDILLRGIFADWLMENGRWQAGMGQQWLIKHGKIFSKEFRFLGKKHCSFCDREFAIQLQDIFDIHQLYSLRSSMKYLGFRSSQKVIKYEHERVFLTLCNYFVWDDDYEPNMIISENVLDRRKYGKKT